MTGDEERSGSVTGIIASGGVGPDTVSVSSGGPTDIPALCDRPVQVGDVVVIAPFHGQWLVRFNFNRKSTDTVVPLLTFGNTSLGGRPVATTEDATGSDGRPHLHSVYTTPVVPPTPATTIPPTFSRTWDPTNNWDLRSDEVRQGTYPSIGAATGCYFYPDIVAALAGGTPTGCSIHVTRPRRGGASGARTVHVALHTATGSGSAPTVTTGTFDEVALPWGASGDISLPADWVTALATGAALGVCITSSSTNDYMILNGASAGSGVLSFTY